MDTVKKLNKFLHEHDAYLNFYWNYKHVQETHKHGSPSGRVALEKQGKNVLSNSTIARIIDQSFFWNNCVMITNPEKSSSEYWNHLYIEAMKLKYNIK